MEHLPYALSHQKIAPEMRMTICSCNPPPRCTFCSLFIKRLHNIMKFELLQAFYAKTQRFALRLACVQVTNLSKCSVWVSLFVSLFIYVVIYCMIYLFINIIIACFVGLFICLLIHGRWTQLITCASSMHVLVIKNSS